MAEKPMMVAAVLSLMVISGTLFLVTNRESGPATSQQVTELISALGKDQMKGMDQKLAALIARIDRKPVTTN